jgi:hypothetical protein
MISDTDRQAWLPPPSQEWQDAHRGNGANSRELLASGPAESEASIPRRVYVVPGYLPRGVITELIGPSSSGKSMLAVTWAVALALGRAIGGFKAGAPDARRGVQR